MIFRSITLQEANLFLPIVKEHLSKIHGLVAEGQILHEKILSVAEQADASGGTQASEETGSWKQKMGSIEQEIRVEMLAIQQYGALVKSIFPARVDFRSERHKQPVYLCWETGDPAISHWHPTDESSVTRRFIDKPLEFGVPLIH